MVTSFTIYCYILMLHISNSRKLNVRELEIFTQHMDLSIFLVINAFITHFDRYLNSMKVL